MMHQKLALAVSLLWVAGCGQKATPPESLPPSAAALAAAQTAGELSIEATGNEPRRPGRIGAKPGDKQTLEISTRATIEVKVAGQVQPTPATPSTVLVIDGAVVEALDEGGLRLSTTVREARAGQVEDARPEAVAALDAALQPLVGFDATLALDPNGRLIRVERTGTAPPPGGPSSELAANLESALARIVTPLPDEPFGAGARWSLKEQVVMSGVQLVQTSRFHVIEREGDRLRVEVQTNAEVGAQVVKRPGAPEGDLRIKAMTVRGLGELQLDLSHALPTQSKMRVETRLVTFGGPGSDGSETETSVVSDVVATSR